MGGFKAVYEEYAKPVYRFLLSLTGSKDAAEELLQETFFRALQHIDRFEGRCSLYTWLCRIGKNVWIRECRRNSRRSTVSWEELCVTSGDLTPELLAIRLEEYQSVREAIQKLEEPYRDVFVLHAIGEVKLKEIAQIHGKSESWARVTYFRAKQQIIQEVSK